MVGLPGASAPETVFFSLTIECPLRCKVCSMWQLTDPADALTPEQRLEVVDQIPGFGRSMHVVVTGGEPFTKPRELFAIAERVRDQGNTMGVITSGLFLTPSVVERLSGSGITHVAVSIDFPSAAQHDAQRGRLGTFERAVAAIRRLVEMRASGQAAPTVGINTIVMAQNVNYLEDLAMLAADLGVKEILFQPIQPDFGLDDSVALDKVRQWLPLDLRRVQASLVELEGLRSRAPLGQTPGEFERMREYFARPLRLRPGHCVSPRLNLMVDVRGGVTHCFGQARTGLPPLGAVPRDNIVSLWRGGMADRNRATLASCPHGCGALLCHSRSSVVS